MLDTYKCGYYRHIHVKCKVYPGLLGAGLFFLKLVRNSLYIHSGGALYVVT